MKTNCFHLFAHKRIKLLNFRNLVCTAFLANVVWFTSATLKENKTNREKAELGKSAVSKYSWTNGHRIKWNEATILAMDNQKFSRKMKEIEKHIIMDQEGKPVGSSYVALSLYYAKLISLPSLRAHELIRTFLLIRFNAVDLTL